MTPEWQVIIRLMKILSGTVSHSMFTAYGKELDNLRSKNKNGNLTDAVELVNTMNKWKGVWEEDNIDDMEEQNEAALKEKTFEITPMFQLLNVKYLWENRKSSNTDPLGHTNQLMHLIKLIIEHLGYDERETILKPSGGNSLPDKLITALEQASKDTVNCKIALAVERFQIGFIQFSGENECTVGEWPKSKEGEFQTLFNLNGEQQKELLKQAVEKDADVDVDRKMDNVLIIMASYCLKGSQSDKSLLKPVKLIKNQTLSRRFVRDIDT